MMLDDFIEALQELRDCHGGHVRVKALCHEMPGSSARAYPLDLTLGDICFEYGLIKIGYHGEAYDGEGA